MKKKKIVLFVFLIVGVLSLVLTYKFKQSNLNKIKPVKEEKLSIMIKEDGATDYTKSSSKDIPKGNYTLNKEKSYCNNNGKIEGYDSTTGTVSFAFIGTDRCFLYFDYYVLPRKAYDAILLDNGNGATTVDEAKTYISGKGTPTFTDVATTNEGMYATEDDYTATTGMKSYYFRGAVDNNWIKFGKYSSNGPVRGYYSSTASQYKEYNSLEECNSASNYNYNCSYAWNENDDIYWRIIRINGDGSIRMIYTGTTDPKTDSSVTGSNGVYMTGIGTQIGKSAFNSNYDKSEYVGYMYTAGEQHGNSTPSTIKNTLENWYAGTTLKDNSLVSQDQIFCNDRSVTSGTWSSSPSSGLSYASDTRLSASTPIPQLTCPTESDKFTSKKSSIGNKKLEYPVGLITADELAMAGGKYRSSNSPYYLYTNLTYWSGTPVIYIDGYAYESYVEYSGGVSLNWMNNYNGARPVVSLSSKAKLSGNGTWNKPYVVEN